MKYRIKNLLWAPLVLLMVACGVQKPADSSLEINSGVTGQGLRYLMVNLNLGESKKEVETLSLNAILIPFELKADNQLESFLLLDERGEEGKSPHPVFGSLIGEKKLNVIIQLDGGKQWKYEVNVGKVAE